MSQREVGAGAWLDAFLRVASHGGRARQNEGLIAAGMVTSLAYYYVVPLPLVALPGLLCFAALAWVRLDLALCLLPLTFPFWYVPKRVMGHVVFPLSEIALGVCIAVAVVILGERVLRSGRGSAYLLRYTREVATRIERWQLIGASLLLIGMTVGVVIARRPHEALRVWRWEIVEPLLYVLLVTAFVRSARMARWLVWSFLGSALLVAVLAAVQVLWLHVTFASLAQGSVLIPYSVPGGGVPRATAFIFISGNTLGTWLARALPLALALAVAGGGGKDGWMRRERLAAVVCGVACVLALVWSASRGAWIAAGLACLVVACLVWRRLLWPVAAVGVVGLLVALWQRETLAAVLLGGHGGTGEVRVLVWLAAWHMIRDHMVLGIGPDQFLYYYSNLYTSHPYWITVLNGHTTLAAREPDLAQAHNLLLDLWLSGGLLALGGFFLALGVCWRRCLGLWRTAEGSIGGRLNSRLRAATAAAKSASADWEEAESQSEVSTSQGQGAADARLATANAPWYSAAALGIGGLVLAGVLHGMVDNGYFAPDLALAFWWAVAVVIVLERGVLKRGTDAVHTSTGGAHRGAAHY